MAALIALRDSSDHKQKTAAAAELRDNLDALITPDAFQPLVDCLESLLLHTPPVFVNVSPQQARLCAPYADLQKLRYTLLEIIHRLPLTDVLKPHVKQILQLMNKVIRTDNEDNAMLCLKVIIDLHKHFKSLVEDQVQPFLDLVQDIYRNMPQTVRESFDPLAVPFFSSPAEIQAPNPPSFQSPKATSPNPTGDSAEVALRNLSRGMASFKTLTECPIIVVLLFQNYRQCVAKNLLAFTLLIIEVVPVRLHTHDIDAQAATIPPG
ncbi:Transformation/transcription domain-associated protein [Neolecta irregularis DAH-3]|uniref:Transformation/transcription domain-associated protein n=1 Tax=Neolecta irregularis (strain DAH-3) TaxID=1198029 RepID=A0A1U7LHR1_NEOID|nr:Transformation/transcription domain-associated protein [Neolecta irregularis DAH-3]|eukprot:OLL22133.1 Transformation/transcription domain-associated protein [Neolecta irregularis DAH-3]